MPALDRPQHVGRQTIETAEIGLRQRLDLSVSRVEYREFDGHFALAEREADGKVERLEIFLGDRDTASLQIGEGERGDSRACEEDLPNVQEGYRRLARTKDLPRRDVDKSDVLEPVVALLLEPG